MEFIILKIIAVICVAIVAGIMAWQDKEEAAWGVLISGLIIIFIPWDKLIDLIR